ncbi:MAG: hypothetical protein ACK559_18245, partial [bacterium]
MGHGGAGPRGRRRAQRRGGLLDAPLRRDRVAEGAGPGAEAELHPERHVAGGVAEHEAAGSGGVAGPADGPG